MSRLVSVAGTIIQANGLPNTDPLNAKLLYCRLFGSGQLEKEVGGVRLKNLLRELGLFDLKPNFFLGKVKMNHL